MNETKPIWCNFVHFNRFKCALTDSYVYVVEVNGEEIALGEEEMDVFMNSDTTLHPLEICLN